MFVITISGGKRAAGSKGVYDHNPCFCLPSIANCTDHITGLIFIVIGYLVTLVSLWLSVVTVSLMNIDRCGNNRQLSHRWHCHVHSHCGRYDRKWGEYNKNNTSLDCIIGCTHSLHSITLFVHDRLKYFCRVRGTAEEGKQPTARKTSPALHANWINSLYVAYMPFIFYYFAVYLFYSRTAQCRHDLHIINRFICLYIVCSRLLTLPAAARAQPNTM